MGGKGQQGKGSGNGLPRNNKNRPAGSGTTSHARRERVRAAAQARDKAKEEEEKAKKEEQRVKDEEEKKMMDKKKEEENQNMKDKKKEEEDKQVSLDKREKLWKTRKPPLTRGKLQKTRRFPLTKGKVQRSWAQVTPKRKKTLGLICSKEKRSGSQNLLLLLQALPATFHPCQKGPLLPRLLAKRRNLLPVTRKRLLVKRNQHKKAAAAAAQNQSPVIGEAAAQTSHPQHPTQRKKTRWMTQALGRSQRRSQKSQQYWCQSCLNGWLWIGTRPLSQKMGTLTEGPWKSSERLAAKSGWCPGVAMKERSKCDKN